MTTSITWNKPDISRLEEVDLESEPDEDLEEAEVWLENPVMGAEELLRFARVRQLLRRREPWQNQSAIPSARSASMRKSSWMHMGPRSRPWAGTTIWKTRSASRSRQNAPFFKVISPLRRASRRSGSGA